MRSTEDNCSTNGNNIGTQAHCSLGQQIGNQAAAAQQLSGIQYGAFSNCRALRHALLFVSARRVHRVRDSVRTYLNPQIPTQANKCKLQNRALRAPAAA